MRRFFAFFVVIFTLFSIALSVSAATGASSVGSHATVASDGSCQVTVSATLFLEEPVEKLYFPVPGNATGVTLNGSRVGASKDGNVRNIDLRRVAKGVTGNVSVNIHYSLRDVIHTTEDGLLQMQVPLLSGFAYPVQRLEFSVTLPGATDTLPGFVSGYHQANIEKDLTYTVQGAMISGSSSKALKDHETLIMTMTVSPDMFPQSIVNVQDHSVGLIAMAICAALALLYWLITLSNLPVLPLSVTQPPQGSNAGLLGCMLSLQGADLNLMVLDWARLGYILIRVKNKKVLLQKQMDMGNECSDFERHCFNRVFKRGAVADTSQAWYAEYCRLLAKKPAGIRELISRHSGNTRVFRFLASGIGLFGGAAVGMGLGNGALLQWLLIILLAAFGAFSGWSIQSWLVNLLSRRQSKLYPLFLLCCFWLLLGLIADVFIPALVMVAGLLVAGILLFWAGRRTLQGRSTREQLFALRRYMKRLDSKTLQQLCKEDPDYFFRLAPAAMALGIDREFARRFGRMRFSGCPYLTTGFDPNMTAVQWYAFLRKTMAKMDDRADQLPREKLLRLIQNSISR